MKGIPKIQGICKDCGKEAFIYSDGVNKGVCDTCKLRKQNAKVRGKIYTPYLELSEEQKSKIDAMQKSHIISQRKKKQKEIIHNDECDTNNKNEIVNESNVVESNVIESNVVESKPQYDFIELLRDYGCEISEKNLNDVLKVLDATDTLKELFITIVENNNQQAMLDLDQSLNVAERKLQHEWEYNGFQSEDDVKFKTFLNWRRKLKGAMFFWKKLYQSNTLLEMQRAWDAYTTDPSEKITAKESMNSIIKRWQITTESVSTIFNTRRPFTRVFYAKTKEEAYKSFVDWMSDRQLHEDKSKTTIVELKSEDNSKDGRERI